MQSIVQRLVRNKAFITKVLFRPGQSRHLLRWIGSQADDYLLNEPCPWLTFDAIEYLVPHLRKGTRVFEFGSGGSTLFWLLHGATCVSVEHDPEWHALVQERLGVETSIDYRLVAPELAEASDWHDDPTDPDEYASSVGAYRGYSFLRYASQIEEFLDEWFDLVVVDGRARPSCIKHSVSKVRIGGILIVDNSDREYYFEKTRSFLEDFEAISYSGVGPVSNVMWKTSMFVRLR